MLVHRTKKLLVRSTSVGSDVCLQKRQKISLSGKGFNKSENNPKADVKVS